MYFIQQMSETPTAKKEKTMSDKEILDAVKAEMKTTQARFVMSYGERVIEWLDNHGCDYESWTSIWRNYYGKIKAN